MMLMCVGAYSLLWLPLNIYNILRDVPGVLDNLPDDLHFILFFAVHWLAMAHTCCNPLIYFRMNHRFKLAYLQTFSSICCSCFKEFDESHHSSVLDFDLNHSHHRQSRQIQK